MAVILCSGLLAKAFLRLTTRCHVSNLDSLLAALPDKSNPGLLTYSNHISTLDDPLWCGVLPWRLYTQRERFRWTLGAKDICFTNPLFSAYFRAGQVLPTERRGPGIYQASIDQAISVLQSGGWVHIFPEGYVNQPSIHPYVDPFRRFRWGISRLINESPLDVRILPMYLQGFDSIMPEGRKGIAKFVPRLGQAVSVNFDAQPLDRRKLIDPLMVTRTVDATSVGPKPEYSGEPATLRESRSRIADVLRNALIDLKNSTV